ncbi:TIGR03086 family metal-binding protein [Streptomyces sp. NPDC048337]|uniref:TIGR03086 family metal-binding protein n=1 Tax=Streptomyces sp. NPDC048337 TaxID=3365535 RepID=UPI00371D1C6A
MNQTVTRYRRALAGVDHVVDRMPAHGWSSPSPCPGWTGLHVLGHIIDGQRQIAALLSGQGPREPLRDPAEAVVGQPVAAWADALRAMREVLGATDPDRRIASHHGEVTAEWVLGTAVIEPLVHAWDLAWAGGFEASLDGEAVGACLVAVAPVAEQFAATGMYAPALAASARDTPQQQLLALLGRNATAGRGR